jgi:hypothetical protein
MRMSDSEEFQTRFIVYSPKQPSEGQSTLIYLPRFKFLFLFFHCDPCKEQRDEKILLKQRYEREEDEECLEKKS